MQNKYVGDIGDYVKLAILRALSPGYRLGIAWWLVVDEDQKKDGTHISYLCKPEKWRRFDPNLFDGLRRIVASKARSVAALEKGAFLPGCLFASTTLPLPAVLVDRVPARKRWISEIATTLNDVDLLFLDPDNGIEPDRFSPRRKTAVKSVTFDDLASLRRKNRTLIVYHHQTRRKGGHIAEIQYQVERLRSHGYGHELYSRSGSERTVLALCLAVPSRLPSASRFHALGKARLLPSGACGSRPPSERL